MKTRGQRILYSNCWAFCYINQYISLYKMKAKSTKSHSPFGLFLHYFCYIKHSFFLHYTFTLLILYIQFTYIIHYHSSHIKNQKCLAPFSIFPPLISSFPASILITACNISMKNKVTPIECFRWNTFLHLNQFHTRMHAYELLDIVFKECQFSVSVDFHCFNK